MKKTKQILKKLSKVIRNITSVDINGNQKTNLAMREMKRDVTILEHLGPKNVSLETPFCFDIKLNGKKYHIFIAREPCPYCGGIYTIRLKNRFYGCTNCKAIFKYPLNDGCEPSLCDSENISENIKELYNKKYNVVSENHKILKAVVVEIKYKFCSECGDDIDSCDICEKDFNEFDSIYCYVDEKTGKFNHRHIDCKKP